MSQTDRTPNKSPDLILISAATPLVPVFWTSIQAGSTCALNCPTPFVSFNSRQFLSLSLETFEEDWPAIFQEVPQFGSHFLSDCSSQRGDGRGTAGSSPETQGEDVKNTCYISHTNWAAYPTEFYY